MDIILHSWALDKNGEVEYYESGFHGGPRCVRCRYMFCQHCRPQDLTEPCHEQTPDLF